MDWQKRIRKLFRRQKVVTLEEISRELDERSRASIFRDLSELDYLSSYSHNGKCFTLRDIALFDSDGVWRFEEVGFSKHGTLKKAVSALVEYSKAGHMHDELQRCLHVRVHNTLLSLVSEGEIARTDVDGQYLYLSKEFERAKAQLEQRKRLTHWKRPITAIVPSAAVIEVLAEVIRTNRIVANARDITKHLIAKGIEIAATQVEQVLEYFEVKKRPHSK